ncbi:hypothetical protein ABT324_28140 [Saccharopolyspora sp. NPDC000359]|uniref:hypothetical protein n=1 Tax=Saccharopolyspora sp. NPDC000359 TaxID=3154251 RepID=UPI0033215127
MVQGQSWDRSPHTLAQFARRAGISEGRARALYGTTPSGLPRPDRTDADGRPLWWASTIDAWCARTGREVSGDSLWLFRAPPASGPVPELQRGVVTLGRRGRAQTFFVIVWDTEHGHVIYLQPLEGAGGVHKDGLAVYAAELIEPRWWADAVVIIPIEEHLRFFPAHDDKPLAWIYQLTPRAENISREPEDSGVFGGVRRWFARTMPPELTGPAIPRAQWATSMDLDELAPVVGRSIPVWLGETTSTDNAGRALAYDRTFITTDTVTEWPAAQARLDRAIEIGMPGDYPCAFAALAVEAAEGLATIRSAHEHTPDTGPGWYLVCRPARPAPPIELEQQITAARLVTDLDLVATELTELRAIEGELDIDDPRGEVYAEAIRLLEWQLRRAAKAAGTIDDLSHDYVPVADDGHLRYHAPWAGPVVEAWSKTLTPVADLDAVLRLRRIHRLLENYTPEHVQRAYRDPHGRYVLITNMGGEEWGLAEWPASLQVTSTWTDKTVLAGDHDGGTTTTLLALTPTDDGQMQVDPVPLPARSDRDAFAYGYGGGTPGTTYQALLRTALGDGHTPARVADLIRARDDDGNPLSQLWAAITGTKGPLRLSWPQLQLWARADRKHLQNRES